MFRAIAKSRYLVPGFLCFALAFVVGPLGVEWGFFAGPQGAVVSGVAAAALSLLGLAIVAMFATGGTAEFLKKNGIEATVTTWPLDEKPNCAVDLIKEKKVDLVINIPKHFQKEELTNDYLIRRAAGPILIALVTGSLVASLPAVARSAMPSSEKCVSRPAT